MSKFLGFLLGIAVALVGPAVFGVLAADGGIELNAKEMALAYGIGALIFWAVASYFAGAAALGAALTFGAMIYTVHWIPNRLTNFLNDVPGVTTGMIDGIKQYTLNGVVPILAVISLIYGIQSIVRSVQRRRRARVEADRLQREQEAAVQAQQMPEPPVAVAAPVAGAAVAAGDYPADNRFGSNFGNSNYDDLFDEEPVQTPFTPRNQADEQTTQFDPAATSMAYSDAERDETTDGADERADERADETILVPTDSDQTVLVPTADKTVADDTDSDETVVAASPQAAPVASVQQVAPVQQIDESQGGGDDASQPVPVPEPDAPKHVAPRMAGNQQGAAAPEAAAGVVAGEGLQADDGGEATQAMPIARPPVSESQAPQASAEGAGAHSAGTQGAVPQEDDGGEATQAVPVTRPDAGAPQASTQGTGAHSAAPQEDDGGEATQAVPVSRPQTAAPAAPSAPTPQAPAPQAPAPPVQTPQAAAPQAPAPQAAAPQAPAPQAAAPQAPAPQAPAPQAPAPQAFEQQALAPELFDQEAPGSQEPAPWVSAPRSGRIAGEASKWDDGGEATQAVPVTRPETAGPVARPETAAPVAPQTHTPQAGLHRREEMGQQYRERMDPPDVDDTGEFFVGAFESPTEQPPSRMGLPGPFRPAGT